MLVREKNAKKDAEPISMGWDEAQAAIKAGTHEPLNTEEAKADADDDGKPDVKAGDKK